MSKCYQSGPLSFEYFLDGIKIVSNSGFGVNISKKAETLSRLTACQSTLTLNDTSVTKFEKNELIKRIFGNSIKNSFKFYDLETKNENALIGCSTTNNGYEKKFGCTHRRDIYIDKVEDCLMEFQSYRISQGVCIPENVEKKVLKRKADFWNKQNASL